MGHALDQYIQKSQRQIFRRSRGQHIVMRDTSEYSARHMFKDDRSEGIPWKVCSHPSQNFFEVCSTCNEIRLGHGTWHLTTDENDFCNFNSHKTVLLCDKNHWISPKIANGCRKDVRTTWPCCAHIHTSSKGSFSSGGKIPATQKGAEVIGGTWRQDQSLRSSRRWSHLCTRGKKMEVVQ